MVFKRCILQLRLLLLTVSFLLSLLSLSTVLRSADAKPMPKEVGAVLADYHKEFAKAKEPADKVLRQEASKVAAKLVNEGQVEEARLIGIQVEDKAAGKSVAELHSQLITLFTQYESAVTNAAKPIRAKYVRRMDALLKAYVGKDMAAVIAVGEAKKVIEGESLEQTTTISLSKVANQTKPSANAPMIQQQNNSQAAGSTITDVTGQVWDGPGNRYEFKAGGIGIKTFKTTGNTSDITWKMVGPNQVYTVGWTFTMDATTGTGKATKDDGSEVNLVRVDKVATQPQGSIITPKRLRDFESIEQFQTWLLTTEWVTDNGEITTTFPEPGKMRTMKSKTLGSSSIAKIEIPEIGIIQWHWSTGTIANIKIGENLDTGRNSGNDPIRRTKP
jgi:hypothetical protein